MLLSIYTCVKNGLFYDYHIVDMLKHHLPFADEIVVNEGYSTDGTFERIANLDPKIRVFRSHWSEPKADKEWYLPFKNAARQAARGEWCLLLDADEFIPEWDFENIRSYLKRATEPMIPLRYVNFYGNYKVYQANGDKASGPIRKMVLHRNLPEMEVWGDGSSVRIKGTTLDWNVSPMEFTCHHFGGVRNAARLRQLWRFQGAFYTGRRHWLKLPSFLFNWRPHNWFDARFTEGLAIYDGPYIQAVRENPEEFVRDDFRLYDFVKDRGCPVAV
jgi:glycosyltransferase involved in cell wall biosynthesis